MSAVNENLTLSSGSSAAKSWSPESHARDISITGHPHAHVAVIRKQFLDNPMTTHLI